MKEENKITQFSKNILIPIITKLNEQKHLKAMIYALEKITPMVTISSVCLILAFPPIDPSKLVSKNLLNSFLLNWYYWSKQNFSIILIPFNIVMERISLFIAITTGYGLAKNYEKKYKVDPLYSSIIAGMSFLIAAFSTKSMTLDPKFLGPYGIFLSSIVSMVSVEISKLVKVKEIKIKLPERMPSSIIFSFSILMPVIINIIVFYGTNLGIQKLLGMSMAQTVMLILEPILTLGNSLWFILLIVVVCQLAWFVGVQGAALIGILTTPFFTMNLMINAVAKASGKPLPYIFASPLWSYVITLGGSGATLGLVLLMLRSRSSQLKSIGHISIVPSLFNINESVIFGTPLMQNKDMAVPFFLVPIVNTGIIYYALKLELIGRVFFAPSWTMPAFIGLPLATMDWRAFLLVIFIVIIDLVLYYPFFKVYEKSLINEKNVS